jgi:ubiquinone biosynthesis monooxygenase Coq7
MFASNSGSFDNTSGNNVAAPASSSSTPPADASTVPPLRLSKEQREMLEEMIRIDQAGELGANWIYRGQYAVLGSDKKVGPLLQVLVSAIQFSSVLYHKDIDADLS